MRLALAHLGLAAHDLARMQAFYVDVLGLSVSDHGVSPRRGRAMLFLSGDAAVHHHLVLIEREEAAEDAGAGQLEHLAFSAGSLAALRALRDRARAAEVPARAVDHGNAWSLYLEDPEGNQIEVFTPTPFQMPQPFGQPLDLDRTDAEILEATRRACGAEPASPPEACVLGLAPRRSHGLSANEPGSHLEQPGR